MARQGKARQDKARQDKARHDKKQPSQDKQKTIRSTQKQHTTNITHNALGIPSYLLKASGHCTSNTAGKVVTIWKWATMILKRTIRVSFHFLTNATSLRDGERDGETRRATIWIFSRTIRVYLLLVEQRDESNGVG